jgi:transglutaminase-like putative cysteine protease
VELARQPSLTNGRRLVRAFAVLVFACGLALSAARVLGTRFEPILLIPAVTSVVVGWLVSRWPLIARSAVQVVAFVGSGLLVAYAADGRSADFGRGLLDGPRQVVTTTWPSPRFPTIFVALATLIFVAAAVSVDLAMRARWRALAIAPLVVAMVAMIAVGAPDGPQWEAVLFATASSFALLWIGLDDRVASVRAAMVVATAAGLAALIATVGVSVAVAERANPRHGAPADSELALLDPLAEISAQRDAKTPAQLYLVASPSLGQLVRWRTAALDVYNGESWSTNGRLTPSGNRLATATGAKQITVTVTAVRKDTQLWISPGRILRSSSPVETDSDRRVVRILGARRPAVTTFTVEPAVDFDPATAGSMPTIQPTDIENSYSTKAATMAPTGTINEKVAMLAAALHNDYTYNSDAPGGLSQHLVDSFVRDDNSVGNLEQFVTGFVLLARSLGVNARIATGYQANFGSATSGEISTDQATAWPEVQTATGWAAVDVLPKDTKAPPVDQKPAGLGESPPVLQPLDPTQVEQKNLDDPLHVPLPVSRPDRWSTVKVWALRGGLFTGLLLWPLIVFSMVVTWKKLRRRKGLKAPDPARRVSTAWTLATDALVDAGAELQTSHTNAELVAAGVRTQPAAGPPLGRLQRHADAVTFATASCDPQRAADAVDQLRLVESSIRNSSSRWWRWKWWLSTRSLRRRTQSPLR